MEFTLLACEKLRSVLSAWLIYPISLRDTREIFPLSLLHKLLFCRVGFGRVETGRRQSDSDAGSHVLAIVWRLIKWMPSHLHVRWWVMNVTQERHGMFPKGKALQVAQIGFVASAANINRHLHDP
jgi:hypothetical protein